MPAYVDVNRQIGVSGTLKLIAYTDGAVDPTDFAGETAAFTVELEGFEAQLELEEFSQKDTAGKETKWTGSRSGSFSFGILEKNVDAIAVASGLDPADISTAVANYKAIDVDGTQGIYYWSAYIVGTYADGMDFGYIVKRCHFQPQNLAPIKRGPSTLQTSLVADPMASGASIVAYEQTA